MCTSYLKKTVLALGLVDFGAYMWTCSWLQSIYIFASLALLPDSLWGQRNSSIKLRAHLCPYSSQKEPSSTIRAFFQRYHHRAITRCKNRLQEIDLILIWQNYQERKLEWGNFPWKWLCFKGEMHTLHPSQSLNDTTLNLLIIWNILWP